MAKTNPSSCHEPCPWPHRIFPWLFPIFLLGLAFSFSFLIAGRLTGFFLDEALHLLGSAFNTIVIPCDLLVEKISPTDKIDDSSIG